MLSKINSKVLVSGTLLLLVLSLAACGQTPTSTPTPSLAPYREPLEINKGDLGSRIEIHPGDQIRIQLLATPGAGYSWQILELDEQVLALQGEPQFVSTGSEAVGGSQWQLILLKAVNPGETMLELVYIRLWEVDVPPEDTFFVSIVVSAQ